MFPMMIAAVVASGLTACGKGDSASYLVDGNRDRAFSLFRDQSYAGADWELALALTYLPECQRRHALKNAPGERPYKAELYLDNEGDYFLRSAGAWYEIRLNACALQPTEAAPASPGELLGTWEEGGANNGGAFKFFPAGK